MLEDLVIKKNTLTKSWFLTDHDGFLVLFLQFHEQHVFEFMHRWLLSDGDVMAFKATSHD